MAFALPPNSFSLAYEPSRGTVVGGWSKPVEMAQLRACYEALLAAAQAHKNCRFWLLDLRQRNWHTPEFARWFTTDFVPRAVATLRQPLFIAYLVADEQQPYIESEATNNILRQAAAVNCYPFYFECEPDALAWLHDQYEAEQPALPHRTAVAR